MGKKERLLSFYEHRCHCYRSFIVITGQLSHFHGRKTVGGILASLHLRRRPALLIFIGWVVVIWLIPNFRL